MLDERSMYYRRKFSINWRCLTSVERMSFIFILFFSVGGLSIKGRPKLSLHHHSFPLFFFFLFLSEYLLPHNLSLSLFFLKNVVKRKVSSDDNSEGLDGLVNAVYERGHHDIEQRCSMCRSVPLCRVHKFLCHINHSI